MLRAKRHLVWARRSTFAFNCTLVRKRSSLRRLLFFIIQASDALIICRRPTIWPAVSMRNEACSSVMNVRNFLLRQQSNELGIVNGAQHSR